MAAAAASPGRIQISQTMTLGRASLLMAAMVLLSRITGFGRQVVTSHLYGINSLTDAYAAAFNIPDFISIMIAGGALATGFVPVFTQYLARGEEEAAARTFRAMFTFLSLALGLLSLVLFVLTFTGWGRMVALRQVQPQHVELYFKLLRILLAAQFFFVVGGLFTGTLNALRLFWFSAVQPVVYNLGIIIFGLAGPKFFGAGIESQAWGALFGALIGSIVIQIPAVRRSGLSLAPLWDVHNEGVRRVVVSIGPIVFGLASGQVIALILARSLAGGLDDGAVTTIDNANRIMQLPLAILASGPAIALFPTISLLWAQGDAEGMRDALTAAIRRTLLLTMLASALLVSLSLPIIRLLLEHGKFSAADSVATARVLICYSVGLVALAAQQILARGFYAIGRTKEPVVIGVASIAVFFVLGYLVKRWPGSGAAGLALAASLSIIVLAGWMAVALRGRLGGWDKGRTLNLFWKSSFAALPALVLPTLVWNVMAPWTAQANGLSKLIWTAGALGIASLVGTFAFILVAALLGIEEVRPITAKLLRRK
jgi:putative peptidoglycan lipid II flippase